MKKFLTGAVLAMFVLLGVWYAVYHHGFYLNLHPNAPVSAAFRTEDGQLLRQGDDGEWEPFVLRGVDVSASMPGRYATEFAPEESDYLRWFEAIGEMGANTVRAYTVMDDDFYNALYTYNTSHAAPLYLLQGIQVSDAANQGKADAYDDKFLNRLLKDGRDVVDIIHGRKNIVLNEMRGSGRYRRDLSPWVVGYLVGQEWNSETIAYTNHSAVHPAAYQGKYFETGADATPFEAMLAQVMDTITGYESDKYKTQRLVAFINDPANDPFVYEDSYAAQLSKYNQLDAERILPTDRLRSGYFAAYRLYDFCPDFSKYLSLSQRAALGSILSSLDSGDPYGGYLELLSAYHSVPVIAAGYGFSSARGAVEIGTAPLTERQQGEALVTVYEAAMAADWCGVFLSTWQDTWERRTWNTAFATALSENTLWHDLQADGQSYGLMAFDPGAGERICVLDGNPGEWTAGDVVFTADGLTLSARCDAEGLYLLIEGGGVCSDTPLYVPIDITGESGGMTCVSPKLTFERAADFLLCINGVDGSRLLAQERYDALRENFLFEITGEDPFVSFPPADTDVFVPVRMALQNNTLIDESVALSAEEIQRLRALGTWETGRLIHGNGDPDSEAYHSLADFCFGDNCVEVRLPWLLLNVADPSQMRVHSDYYGYYGVRTHRISKLWIGLGDGSGPIAMGKMTVKGYAGYPKTHERLKESYAVVRAAWKGDDDSAAKH